jgi:hypothetical protein
MLEIPPNSRVLSITSPKKGESGHVAMKHHFKSR